LPEILIYCETTDKTYSGDMITSFLRECLYVVCI